MSEFEVPRHHSRKKHTKKHYTCEFCKARLLIGTENQHQEECTEILKALQNQNEAQEISCELCDMKLPVEEMNDHIMAHLVDNESKIQSINLRQNRSQPAAVQAPRHIEAGGNRHHHRERPEGQHIQIILQNGSSRPRGFLMINSPLFMNRGASRSRANPHIPQRPVDPQKVRSFPVSRFKSEEEVSCTICMEQVKKKEKVKTLPCMHIFHPKCIDEWLSRSSQCPICKFQI